MPPLSVANMLWLKKRYDPDWYNLEWLQRHSVAILPEPVKPVSVIFLAGRCEKVSRAANLVGVRFSFIRQRSQRASKQHRVDTIRIRS